MSHDDPREPSLTAEPLAGTVEPTDPAADSVAAMAEVVMQTKRAVIPAAVIGVLALVVGLVMDQLVGAVGVCIGLGLGMANARVLHNSVQRRFAILTQTPGEKTHFLAGGALRLGVLTLLTLLCVILYLPLGFGIIIGLAVFQITMLVLSGAAMYKSVR